MFHQQSAVERDARMKPVHQALARQQHRLRIDGDAARETLASLPPECNPFDVQGILIGDIEQHEFHVNVGRYGRIANNITSLKRELRKSLHVNREQLGSVDLSCAQPALLGKIIADSNSKTNDRREQGSSKADGSKAGTDGRREEGREQSKGKYDSRFWDNGDFGLYVELVTTGKFYGYMAEQLRGDGIGRDEIKRRFLVDVLAKKGRYPSVVENAFQRLFPSVHGFIRWTNRDGQEHANLIRELQRAESAFVIETVVDELVRHHPRMFVISLHDALYTTVGNVPKVEQAFRRAFDRTGFPMAVKVTT